MNAAEVILAVLFGIAVLGVITYFTLFLADAFGMGIIWLVLVIFLVLCIFIPWLLFGLFVAFAFAAFMAQGFQ